MRIEFDSHQPEDSEVAAVIVAAVTEVFKRPAVTLIPVEQDQVSWRFSGRWWQGSVALRRNRPNPLNP